MSFGQHLRTLREGAGLSRSGLARKAGIPVSTLRGWEGDRGFPGLAACRLLAEALGVPVERFAEGVEDPVEDEPEHSREEPSAKAPGSARQGRQHPAVRPRGRPATQQAEGTPNPAPKKGRARKTKGKHS